MFAIVLIKAIFIRPEGIKLIYIIDFKKVYTKSFSIWRAFIANIIFIIVYLLIMLIPYLFKTLYFISIKS